MQTYKAEPAGAIPETNSTAAESKMRMSRVEEICRLLAIIVTLVDCAVVHQPTLAFSTDLQNTAHRAGVIHCTVATNTLWHTLRECVCQALNSSFMLTTVAACQLPQTLQCARSKRACAQPKKAPPLTIPRDIRAVAPMATYHRVPTSTIRSLTSTSTSDLSALQGLPF